MIKKHKLPIEDIINRLGYDGSSNLYKSDEFCNMPASAHVLKVLSEIQPYAAYLVDGKPFILFFDNLFNDTSFKGVSKLVWNAQIPIAFFSDDNSLKIYNGLSLDMESFLLNIVSETSIKECSYYSDFSYWEITNPSFWNTYIDKYSSSRLNEYLLSNIKFMTETLKNKYHISFATKLVLRIIFIRYLIDRGVDLAYPHFSNDIESSKKELLMLLQKKETLYSLFEHLKKKFNGNLFDLGNEANSTKLTTEVFTLLTEFVSGSTSLFDGQISLFSMYDFNIIPVELISNIYEILLGNEAREKDNAFYTPSYLVEYILDKTTTSFLQKNAKYKILDPACGSGIFLVDSYRRIVEQTLNGKLFCEDDTTLANLLSENIFGIDINDEAIDVTIFSLYLTVLDYKDPKTLSSFTLPNLKGINLFVSDFFDEEGLSNLTNIQFDFIIGNPPWGNVKDGSHVSYCKKNNYTSMQQNNEISRSFVFRAKDFSTKETVCCFILHSKLLYNQKNPAINFRKFMLEKTKIFSILEMSSVRKLVFKNADAPAAVITFQYSSGENLSNKISYTSLKPNIFFKLFDVIVVEKNDVKYIQQRILFENDWAWKTIVYGFARDYEIVKKLKNNYITLFDALNSQEPKISMGAGVEYQDGDKIDSSHLVGKKLLNSQNGVDHFFVNSKSTTEFTKTNIHRPREKELFEAPYVLIPTGIDCENYKLKAAYCEDSFVSKKTMYILKGTPKQKDFFMNIVGLLNSSLYAYLNIMLGSSAGIEREQRFMKEVLEFPYVYRSIFSEKAKYIQDSLQKNDVLVLSNIEDDISELDSRILCAFNLKNNNFLDYAINIQIPELTNNKEANIYRKVSYEDLLAYCKYFVDQFSLVYRRIGKYISVNIYVDILKKYAAFELCICDSEPVEVISRITVDDTNKELLSKLCVFKHNDLFYQLRDIVHFSENSFFIIKPNLYKYWHPAVAELDLADVTEQIMSDSGGDE